MAGMTETTVGERAELPTALARSRYFLRNTTHDLTDEQAAACPTVSALCLGGLIKQVERTDAAIDGAKSMG
jgi:hypothetical protein